MRKLSSLILLSLVTLAGCASMHGNSSVVQIGPDMYMIGGGVGVTSYATTTLKAKLYQEASQFCTSRTRVIKTVDATSLVEKANESGRVELQFYCLLDSDYRLR
jgi:hypothetical protein